MEKIMVVLNGKDLEATPITEKGWNMLASLLKGKLLDDTKLIEDRRERAEAREDILNQDYDVNDVIKTRRRDIFKKMLMTVFGSNKDISEENVFELLNDENWIPIWRDIMSRSGISFVEQKDDTEENPTQKSETQDG